MDFPLPRNFLLVCLFFSYLCMEMSLVKDGATPKPGTADKVCPANLTSLCVFKDFQLQVQVQYENIYRIKK